MSRDRPATLVRVATGAAAGLVAGLAASFAMDRFQALTQPSSDQDGEPATQQAADGVAKAVTGARLPDDAKPVGGQLVHYVLGAALGVGYGIAAEFVPKVTIGDGAAFASATWVLLDETAVPAAGLGDPPWKSPPKTHAYSFVSHLVFGLTAEAARRLARAALAGTPRAFDLERNHQFLKGRAS